MMSESRSRYSCGGHDGFIVVAALWILSALAALASIYSIYVANAATSVALNDDVIRAEALLSASVELTAYRVTSAPREERPTRGRFAFRMNGADVAVEFCSEAARVDLNKASKALLSGLFGALGAGPDDADQYAERIIGWRSAPSSDSQDREESLYRAAGLSYGPRGAPFAHVGELEVVLGLPPAMVDRAIPFVTVYSGRPDINIRDAAPEVIAALPGMTPEKLNAALNDRDLVIDQSSVASQAEVTTEGSKAMRVTVRMAFDSGRSIASAAVILIDGRDEPYRVLFWQSDADVRPAMQPVSRNIAGGRS
jgi:general secretion pathway protein K